MRPRSTLTALAVVSLAVVALVAALPATAAVPTFKGSVGPGFTITMPKKPTKPGKIKLVISDKSSIHDFHLTGPGVNIKTSVPGTGTKTFTITLKKGTYKFVCDPHSSSMKGSFKIS
jgi:plastocyanin